MCRESKENPPNALAPPFILIVILRAMNSPDLNGVQSRLKSKQRIVILTHSNPDGDAMGSSLGLCAYLRNKGHVTRVIVPNDFPDFLAWLPGSPEVLVFEKNKAAAADLINDASLIFCLDFNTLKRIGEPAALIEASSAYKVMIDHHQQPDSFPDCLFHDTNASSTAELVYDFITAMGDQKLITAESGICLYTGIMTDTASFRFPSASPHTLQIAASLKELGVETHRAHEQVYDVNTEDRLRLMGYAISEKMVVLKDVKTAYISITKAELERFNFRKGDTEGLVNWCLSVSGIILGVFFMEKDNEIRLSLRSKGKFDVNAMARKYFNGGGHIHAAGGSFDGNLQEAVKKLESILPSYADELKRS